MKILNSLILISISVILVTASCAKDEVDLTGSVYGKVTDAFTGEPLQSAMVTLTPGGLSTTTGSDGVYEFKSLDPGDYSLQVSKAGYITNTKRTTVTTGGVVTGDIALEPEQDITISVSTLNFGKELTSLSFEIRNNGSTKCNWNISGLDDVDWLEFNPSTGTLEAGKSNAVKVLLLRDKLSTNKETTILINSNKESVALKITAEVEAKTSKIELSTNTLNFGKDNSSLTFDIKNIGNAGDVNWDITNIDVDWLVVSPKSGSTAMDKSSVVKVDVDRNKLTENSTTNIIVNCEGESLPVTINAEVEAKTSKIELSTNTLNFGKEYSSLTFDVKNIGNAGIANWNITNIDVDWLVVSPKSGSTAMGKSSVVKVDVDRNKLKENSTTNIIVNSDGESLPVTINAEVKPARTWAVYPATIDFGTNSTSSVSLYSYNGNTDYTLSVRGNASWLKISKTSGTIPEYNSYSDTKETIALNVDRTGLSAGTYQCELVVQSDLGEQSIPVKMTVSASGGNSGTGSGTTCSGEIISCDADLQFTLNSCTVSGTTATITYKVKNIGNSDVVFGELRSPKLTTKSVVYDDQGNQYTDVTLTIGNSEGTNVKNTIPSGASVNCSIKIRNVLEKASLFSSIKLFIYNVYTDIDEEYLYLKNVSIEGRNKYEESDATISGTIETCDSDLDFRLTAVDIIGSSVEVSYKVTNIGYRDVQFGELRGPKSTTKSVVYDDQGNQYTDVTLTIGAISANSVSVNIPVGASVNGKIKVKDIDPNATEFSVIKLYIYNVHTDIDEEYLYLKNVKFK